MLEHAEGGGRSTLEKEETMAKATVAPTPPTAQEIASAAFFAEDPDLAASTLRPTGGV